MIRRGWHTALLWMLAIALLAPVLAPALAAASSEPVTAEEYARRVAQARELVGAAEGERLSDRDATDLAIGVNALVPLELEVETPDGVMIANHSLLRTLVARLDASDEVDQRSDIVDEMAAQLASLESAVGQSGESVPHDQAALDEIVGSQSPPAPSALEEAITKLAERFGRWLQEWWESRSASPGVRRNFTTATVAVIIILGLLLAFLVARLVIRMRAGLAKKRTASPSEPDDAVVAAARDLPPDALAYADRCAQDGDMREAIRALFGGAARELQEAGYIVEARTRTNHELLLEVRPHSPVVFAPLENLVREFERVWYGHRSLGAHEYARAREHYVAVHEEIANTGGVSR